MLPRFCPLLTTWKAWKPLDIIVLFQDRLYFMIWQNCIIFRPKLHSMIWQIYIIFSDQDSMIWQSYIILRSKSTSFDYLTKICLFFSDQDRLHLMIIETGRGAWAKRPKKVAVQGHAVEVLHHQRKESMDTIITSKAKILFYSPRLTLVHIIYQKWNVK